MAGFVMSVEIADVKDIVEIAALGVGGFWTYLLFIKGREDFPKATLTHALLHRQLPADKVFLRVTTRIANPGKVVLNIRQMTVRLQRVLPLSDHLLAEIQAGRDPVDGNEMDINWPGLTERQREWAEDTFQIEPGESDEVTSDFVLDRDVETVQVYTYFRNLKKPKEDTGWGLTTLYDFRQTPTGSAQRTVQDLGAKERRA